MKKDKPKKAPKVASYDTNKNYMKESGTSTKKGGGIDMRRKTLSK